MAVVIETTLGDITVDLFLEERPRACLNFLKLCKLKYYNFNLFHNIERGFIAQSGDPTGAGNGGESVWGVVEGFHKRYFEAESLPKIKHTAPELISMVSVGKNMVGSQFFFTLGKDLTSLDGIHCVFGEVTEGREILRKLNEAIVDDKFRPYQDIRITHTVILEDPFDDPRGFQIPSRSPSPTPERLKNGRIGADEDIDDTEGKTFEEIQEMLQEREAKARATILEIVGDLPDANIAPPENVLFICKLNPVTTDDDLEIIFSRFGVVKSCEVIRDKVSGDSLQYAFVEFEDKKSCENAFFKMDNVLIDDRRIHVDFSQSVAKVRWRGKGRGVIRSNPDEKLDFDNLRETKRPQRPNYDKPRRRSRSPGQSRDNRFRDHREHLRHNYNRDRDRHNYNRDREERKRMPRNRSPEPSRSRYVDRYREDRMREKHDDRKPRFRERMPERSTYQKKRERPSPVITKEKRRTKKDRKVLSSSSSSSPEKKKKSKKRKKSKRRSSSSSSSSDSSSSD